MVVDRAVDHFWNKIPEKYKTLVAFLILLVVSFFVLYKLHKSSLDSEVGSQSIEPLANTGIVQFGASSTAIQTNIYQDSVPQRVLSEDLKQALRSLKHKEGRKCIYVENKTSRESVNFANEIYNFMVSEKISTSLLLQSTLYWQTDIKPTQELVIIDDRQEIDVKDEGDCLMILVLSQLK